MTNRHQDIRDLVDHHRDQEETPDPYEKYAAAALECIRGADDGWGGMDNPAVQLQLAQIYATLALAAATVNTTACGVHCRAIGC